MAVPRVAGDAWGIMLCGYALLGMGMAFSLAYWGLAFCQDDEGRVERAFVSIMALAGGVVPMLGIMPYEMRNTALLLLPLGELALLLIMEGKAGFQRALDAGADSLHAESSSARGCLPEPAQRHLAQSELMLPLLARVCLINVVVTFAWAWACRSDVVPMGSSSFIVACGFVGASLLMWLFVRYSPTIGFAAAARYALPLLAAGVLLVCVGGIPWGILGFFLLASAHASFEMYLRLRIVNAVAQSSETALCDAEEREPADSIEARKARMAEAYGLTKRETELLHYLLEGRSHPYIRDALYISKSTVDTHVRHIYAKVGVSSKQDLIDKSFNVASGEASCDAEGAQRDG